MARPRKGVTFDDRVAAGTVAHPNGCWEWAGCKDGCGYGRINRDGKLVRLHRAAWEKENGDIPEGMCICHHCDNPSCINPSHLFIGTQKDNMRDRARKGRYNNAGEDNNSAILKTSDVLVIRERIKKGDTCYSIGREYGVTGEAILAIKHHRTWKHVA